VIERATGRLIGRGGLFRPEGWPDLEVGWVLAPSSWGRGFASELGRAARDHAFEVLGADHLISLITPDNSPSIRVAEAIGSRLESETVLDRDLHVVYGQDAA
jgi:RimJ/RimL family protein N-acetyltransferase